MVAEQIRNSVGIVTRTRDRTVFVIRALRSVLAQSHGDWQVALVNDGGDAAGLRAAIAAAGLDADLPAGRVTILDNPESRGRAAAFNQGLAALETRFIACLDDDDSWDPDFLRALVAFHDETAAQIPDLGGVASGVKALREDVSEADGRQRIVPLGEDGLANAFKRNDFLIGPIAYAAYRHDLYPVQWMLQRAAVLATGGFPEDFDVMEDRAFLLRFLQDWRIATLDRPLAFHHRRVRRTEDSGQSAEMNTLDNPSYDWRRFADLALPALTVPAGASTPDLPRLMRAVGASVVTELNQETSALWHKVNGEAEGLCARLDAIEARIAGIPGPDDRAASATASGARPVTPAPVDTALSGRMLWSLWPAVGAVQVGFGIAPGRPFLERLELSHAGEPAGLLMHADPHRRLLQLQIPQSGDWCALELVLSDLATPGRGLTCRLVLDLPRGGLFETAQVILRGDESRPEAHALRAPHVHAADAGQRLTLTRRIESGDLEAGVRKLSVILPRQATNLRLRLHDATVFGD